MWKYSTIVLLTALLILSGCGDSCENENPTVQLVNSGTEKADVQIKTSGGNTENINNIEPGTTSSKRSFDQGDIEFTVTVQAARGAIR